MSFEATAWHFHTDARATARARMSVQDNVVTPCVAGYRPRVVLVRDKDSAGATASQSGHSGIIIALRNCSDSRIAANHGAVAETGNREDAGEPNRTG